MCKEKKSPGLSTCASALSCGNRQERSVDWRGALHKEGRDGGPACSEDSRPDWARQFPLRVAYVGHGDCQVLHCVLFSVKHISILILYLEIIP